jgi:hypothetical protein
MHPQRFTMTAALSLLLASPVSAQQPSPSYCVPNDAHESYGIVLAEHGENALPNGTMVRCGYSRTGTDPLPANLEVGFRIRCPSDKRLALPGYSITSGDWRSIAVVSFVPGTDSAGLDFVDLSLKFQTTAIQGQLLTTYALCR